MQSHSTDSLAFALTHPIHCRPIPSWALLTFAAILAGCSPANELGRQSLSGTVHLDGKPIPEGSIAFEPTTEEGIRSGAPIVDGQFEVPELKGLPPGEYLVRINAAEQSQHAATDEAPGMLGRPSKELIPPRYNTKSREKISIPSDSGNHFVFDIQSGG